MAMLDRDTKKAISEALQYSKKLIGVRSVDFANQKRLKASWNAYNDMVNGVGTTDTTFENITTGFERMLRDADDIDDERRALATKLLKLVRREMDVPSGYAQQKLDAIIENYKDKTPTSKNHMARYLIASISEDKSGPLLVGEPMQAAGKAIEFSAKLIGITTKDLNAGRAGIAQRTYNNIKNGLTTKISTLETVISRFGDMLQKAKIPGAHKRLAQKFLNFTRNIIHEKIDAPVKALEPLAAEFESLQEVKPEPAGEKPRHLIARRIESLGIELKEIGEHFQPPVSKQRVRQWKINDVSKGMQKKIFAHLGMNKEGGISREQPEWIGKLKAVRDKFLFDLKTVPEAVSKMRKIFGMPADKRLQNVKRYGTTTQETLDEIVSDAGFDTADALRAEAAKPENEYFDTHHLGSRLKHIGIACDKLRNHLGATSAEILTQAMPHKAYRMEPPAIWELERFADWAEDAGLKDQAKLPHAPSQKSLCNLLAGLYKLDQEKPPRDRLLAKSRELQEFASKGFLNDPAFVYNKSLRIKVERAIDAVMEATAKIDDDFKDYIKNHSVKR